MRALGDEGVSEHVAVPPTVTDEKGERMSNN